MECAPNSRMNQRGESDRTRAVPSALKPLARHIRAALLPGLMFGLHTGAAVAGPQGGQVVGGHGSIAAPNATTTVINQRSHNLAVDWQSFNVGPNELVQFNQPSRDAQALNRIFDQNPSQISGRISANGGVMLMNPNGVFFGPNARVSVGNLVAAGMQIDVDDFMAGRFKLDAVSDADGIVVNQGVLEAAVGGTITLAGKAVRNEGVILASAGRVNLAVGNKVTLDFDGDGLMRFTVDEAVVDNAQSLDEAISNSGSIEADGGDVLIAASAAKDVFTNTINNSGLIKAGRIERSGGQIRLVGLGPSASVLNTGQINADGGDGGNVQIAAADLALVAGDGMVTAKGSTGVGGRVEITGERVGLFEHATVDVSGAAGGGEALIGGGYRGADADVRNATATAIGPDAVIKANALDAGEGGTVIAWAGETTIFTGTIEAKGGQQAGDGGFVETSGKDYLLATGAVDAGAPAGNGGRWLLDPSDVSLIQIAPGGDNSTGGGFVAGAFTPTADNAQADTDQIVAALEGGTSVTIDTSSGASGPNGGEITLDSPISVTLNSGNVSFDLNAQTNILFKAGNSITRSGANALALNLNFDQAGGGGALDFGTSSVTVDSVAITGGAGDDTVDFNTSTLSSGAITVATGNGANWVDFGTASITASALTITGGTGTDTVIGPDDANTWTVTGGDTGSLGAATRFSGFTAGFSAVEALTGGAGADAFNIDNNWGGSLSGGAGADQFMFADTTTVGGSLDGGADQDTLDWSAYNALTTVPIAISGNGTGDGVAGTQATITGGFDNINAVINNTNANNTLTGPDGVTNTWAIDNGVGDGANDGTLTTNGRTFDFTDVPNLIGGDSADDFTMTELGLGTIVSIDGAGGTNSLTGDNVANAFVINGIDIGFITGAVGGFSHIEALTGNGNADSLTFFTTTAVFSGTFDGAGGGSDSVDWGALTGAVDVAITNVAAGGFDGTGLERGDPAGNTTTFLGVETITGSGVAGTAGDSLSLTQGAPVAAAWTVTGGVDDGTLVVSAQTLNFIDFPNLAGDTDVDTFVVNDVTGDTADDITGNVAGGGGDDAFNPAAAGDVNIGGAFQGGAGNDTFNLVAGLTVTGGIAGGTTGESGSGDIVAGPNAANVWSITGDKTGNLTGVTGNFTEIETVQGGTNTDAFAISAAAANISLDGGAGSDTVDWSGFGSAVALVLDSIAADGFGSSSATGLSGFADIDVVKADAGNFGSLEGIATGGTFNVDGIAATTNTYVSTWTLTFADFHTLIGSATNPDSFVFAGAGFSTSFTIDGGAGGGTLSLSADATDRTYTLTALDTGDVDGMNFSNIGTLTAGGGDQLDFSAAAPVVIVDLQNSTAAGILGSGFSGFADFVGNGANATLRAPDGNATLHVTADNGGDINTGAYTFSGFNHLKGGTGNDSFDFGDGVTVASIDGNGGTDTLNLAVYASGNNRIFNLTGGDAGDVGGGMTFAGIDNITGTQGDDTLDIAEGGSLSGAFDGGAGSDTIDWAGLTTSSLTIALTGLGSGASGFAGNETTGDAGGASVGTFDNVEMVVGGPNTDQLTGLDAVAAFDFYDDGSGNQYTSTNTLGFSAVETLEGGSNVDTFTLDALDNTGGADTVHIGTLIGAGGDDRFVFVDDARLAGQIQGGAGAGDTIVTGASNLTTRQIKLLGNGDGEANDMISFGNEGNFNADKDDFSGIETQSGSLFTLAGRDGETNTWTITGLGAVTLSNATDGVNAFTNVNSIAGGDAIDNITFQTTGKLTGGLSGNGGGDTVIADLAAAFVLNAADAGAITIDAGANTTSFTLIENLTGSGANDSFAFNGATAGLSGVIAGAAGTDTLDYSLAATPVTVNLNDTSATRVNGGAAAGFSGITDLIGGGGDDILIADNTANTFNITGPDDGDVDGFNFTDFSFLQSGAAGDIFQFNGGTAAITGAITGDGTNKGTLDYSLMTAGAATAITVNLADRSATLVKGGAAAGFSDIDTVVGADGDDILQGDDTANLFNITGQDDGDIDGAFTFTDFSFLQSGAGGDTFQFNAVAAEVTGTITGGAGTDTLDYASMTGGQALAVMVNLTDASATRVKGGLASGFINIDAVKGDSVNDTLIGTAASDIFHITTANDGDVGGTFAFTDFNNLQDGGGAADTLDYAGATGPLTFLSDMSTIPLIDTATGFEVVAGTGATDVLQGTGGADTFAINSGVTISGVMFTQVEDIEGLAGDDIFNISGAHAGNISGGNDLDTFNLTGTASVLGNILGDGGVDTVNFSGTAVVTGQVDGGAGNDILDFSGYSASVLDSKTGTGRGNVSATTDPIVNAGDDYTSFRYRTGVGIQGDNADTVWLITGSNTVDAVDDAVLRNVLDSWTSATGITGGNQDDIFIFTTTGSVLTGNVDGGGAATRDLLTSDVAANFVISGADQGSIDPDGAGATAATGFAGIESLTGSASSDNFTFTAPAGAISGVIDGNGGVADIVNASAAAGLTINIDGVSSAVTDVDTLTGNGAGFTLAGGTLFTVTGVNSGTADGGVTVGMTFTNWADLEGTTGNDVFNFTTGTVTGGIDGDTGTDTLSYAGAPAAVVSLSGLGANNGFAGSATSIGTTFDNINDLIGSSNTDELHGRDVDATWTLNGTDYTETVSTRTLTFTGTGVSAVEALFGGSGNDTFNVTLSRTGNIDGGDGTNNFNLSGAGTTLTGDLAGGAGADTFDFNDTAAITGTLDGKGGIDTLDWAGTAGITFTLLGGGATDGVQGNATPIIGTAGPGFDNINVFTSNAPFASFTGFNTDATWTVNALNSFQLVSATFTGSVQFNNLAQSLVGGSANDDFVLAGGTLSGSIDGGLGTNSLTADNLSNTWTMTGGAAGSLTGLGSGFTNIDGATGGALDDTFNVSAAVWSGTLAGGAGADIFNLDNDVTGAVSGDAGADVFFVLNNAITVGGDIDGGADADTFRLGQNFSGVNSAGSGDAADVSVTLTANLIGGAGSDTFDFREGSTLIGRVQGTDGDGATIVDTIDTQFSTLGEIVSSTGAGTSGFGIKGGFSGVGPVADMIVVGGDDFDNIDIIIGNGLGTIVGPNGQPNAWLINAPNAGTLNGSGFNNFSILGGDLADTFTFTAAGEIQGGIDGGAGNDVMVTPAGGGTLTVTNAVALAGAAGTNGTIDPDRVDTANATTPAAQTIVNGATAITEFKNIEVLRGSTGSDIFLVNANFLGSIDGGGGAGNNVVDWTGNTDQSATLTDRGTAVGFMGTTTTVGGGFDNVTALFNSNTGTTTLQGPAVAATWTLSGGDAGQITVAGPNRTLTFTEFDILTGGAQTDTFNIGGLHSGNLSGGGGDTNFVFTGTTGTSQIAGSVNGGTGADTLDYTGFGSAVAIVLTGAGINGFNGTELGALTVTAGFNGIDSIAAPALANTLTALDANNTWTVTGADVFTLDSGSGPVAFSNFATLTGGALADLFVFTGGNITGGIDGGTGGNDTLSYAGGPAAAVFLTGLGINNGFTGTATSIGAGGFKNINTLVGSSNTDELHGLNLNAIWTLNGTSYAAGGRVLSFTGTGASAVEDLFGGSLADTFNITTSRTGNIDGGDGANNFKLRGVGTMVTGNLSGGAGADTFAFFDDAAITGTVDGKAGIDELDWQASTAGVSFTALNTGTTDGFQGNATPIIGTTGPGFNNINTASSNAVSTTFTGLNEATSWTINGVNSFQLVSTTLGTLQFNNFAQTLQGGTATDDFTIAGGSLTGGIDGGSGAGNNTLTADNSVNTWTITGDRAGTVTGLGTGFTNIDDVTGGTLADAFTIIGGATFDGTISGGAGLDGIIGGNVANTWSLTGVASGHIGVAGSNDFVSIERLSGGTGDDTFKFRDGALFATVLGGAAGNDILDYSAMTIGGAPAGVVVSGEAGTATFAGAIDATIDGVVGTSLGVSDEIVGRAATNAWTVNGADRGSVGAFTFTGVEKLTGSGGVDTFNFANPGASISGIVNGGGGINGLIGTGFVNAWNILGANAGTMNGNRFANIQNLTAVGANATLSFAGPGTIAGTYTAPTVTLNTTVVNTAGTPLHIAGNLTSPGAQAITTGGGAFTVTGAVTGGGAFGLATANGDVSIGGALSTAGATVITSGAGDVAIGGAVNAATGIFELRTAGGDATIGGGLTTTGETTVAANGGSIDLNGAVDTGTGSFSATTTTGGGNSLDVLGPITAGSVTIASGNSTVRGVTTTGSQTYTGPALFLGDLTGGAMTFNGVSALNGKVTSTGNVTFNNNAGLSGGSSTAPITFTGADILFNGSLAIVGHTLIDSSTNVFRFGGEVVGGAGSALTILPSSLTDIFIDTTAGAGHLNANAFSNFRGHLVIGSQLADTAVPAEETRIVDPPGVRADRITVANDFTTGGPVTFLSSNLDLFADVTVGRPGNRQQVTVLALGDSQGTGSPAGDLTGPATGSVTVTAGRAVLIANNTVVNAGNIRLELGGGELLLAISSAQNEPTFDPSSNAISETFDPSAASLIAKLAKPIGVESIQVVFLTPVQLIRQVVANLDSGVFEEGLSLFGVIGNGIALPLGQCEEAEGCAPNLSEEELVQVIAERETQIADLERRLAAGEGDRAALEKQLNGYRAQLQDYLAYRDELRDYMEAEEEFGDDFEEFDEGELGEGTGQDLPELPVEGEAPEIAQPAVEPEPVEESFEELESGPETFPEAEIPADEFEDIDEAQEEEVDDLAPLEDVEEPPPDEFEELDIQPGDIEGHEQELDDALTLGLIEPAFVNQRRGLASIGEAGHVVWTGDIVLPRTYRRF